MKKCGITEWYLPFSGPAAVTLCRELGLDGIQLGDLGGHYTNYPMLDDRIKNMYFEAIGDSGFTLYSYHPLSLIRNVGIQYDMDSERGKLAMDIYKKSIQICKEYKIPTILMASFAGSKFNNKYELKNTIKMLRECVRIAEDNGVRVTYEGFSDINTMMYLRESVENMSFCYDVINPLKFGFSEPEIDLKTMTRDMIDHIHVKDVPEDMSDFVPLCDGDGNVKHSLDMLNDLGYDGWYFLENHYNEMTMASRGHGLDAIIEDTKRLKQIW